MFATIILNDFYKSIKVNLWAVGLASCSAVLALVSNRSGVGWSWDSTDYVAVGTNIANGRGLLDVTGLPMTVRPPGLSALIAIGISVGFSANLFLLLLNATCAFIVVIVTYALSKRALTEHALINATTAFVAFSPALLWQYSMAWSEPPFIAVLLIAMFVSVQKMSYTKAFLMPLLMTALFFIRYVGPVFAVALMITSFFVNRKQLGFIKSATINSVGFLISFTPCWLWLIRNKRIDGTLTGARAPGGGSLFDPLKTLTGTLGTWVIAKPFEGGIYMSWSDYPASSKFAGSLFLIIFASLLAIITFKKLKNYETTNQGLQNRRNSDVLILSAIITFLYMFFGVPIRALGVRTTRQPHGHPDLCAHHYSRCNCSRTNDPASEKYSDNHRRWFYGSFGLHLTSATKDALAFGKDGRHWSGKGFQELPIHEFVRTLPAKSLLLSNQPQQLFSITKRPSVFNQYQLDAAQKNDAAIAILCGTTLYITMGHRILIQCHKTHRQSIQIVGEQFLI